jgi:hypothetical protein
MNMQYHLHEGRRTADTILKQNQILPLHPVAPHKSSSKDDLRLPLSPRTAAQGRV